MIRSQTSASALNKITTTCKRTTWGGKQVKVTKIFTTNASRENREIFWDRKQAYNSINKRRGISRTDHLFNSSLIFMFFSLIRCINRSIHRGIHKRKADWNFRFSLLCKVARLIFLLILVSFADSDSRKNQIFETICLLRFQSRWKSSFTINLRRLNLERSQF